LYEGTSAASPSIATEHILTLSEPDDVELEELLELNAQEQLDKLIRLRLKGLLAERNEVQFLLELARRAEAEGTDAKAKALLDWMTTLRIEETDPNLKFLIFTEFIPTQEMLCEFLQRHGYSTVTLNGSMSLEELEKREHIAPFLTPIVIIGITGASN